jgi:predicted transcriptional regulator
MARGKRTDPIRATLALALAELGFDPAMVAELAGLSRSTVTDILQGNGPWCVLDETELYKTTRTRVIQTIGENAEALGMAVLAKLDAKSKTGTLSDCLQIAQALLRVEGE